MNNDLISRQAAIDAIRASASKYTGFMEMEMYTDDDAVEAIEGLPSAQSEPKWISVEDRLPQPRELVFVARKDGFVSLGYCFQFGKNPLWNAIRLVPFSPYELPFVGAGHITHWMPLPEAPEGEQE